MEANEAEFRAVFLLAGFDFTNVFPIENGYCGNQCCPDKPWFLFRTEFGLVKIGWRKRIINIDWSDTGFRGEISRDDVTKNVDYIHAWGYGRAVIYLESLLSELRKYRRDLARELASETGEPLPGLSAAKLFEKLRAFGAWEDSVDLPPHVSIVESFEALRTISGNAWDKIADPAEYLGRKEESPPPYGHIDLDVIREIAGDANRQGADEDRRQAGSDMAVLLGNCGRFLEMTAKEIERLRRMTTVESIESSEAKS